MENIATSVRITADANARVASLAKRMGSSKAQVIEAAVRALEDRVFWQDVQEAYAALSDDATRLAKYRAEIAAWDHTLQDGLPAASSKRKKR